MKHRRKVHGALEHALEESILLYLTRTMQPLLTKYLFYLNNISRGQQGGARVWDRVLKSVFFRTKLIMWRPRKSTGRISLFSKSEWSCLTQLILSLADDKKPLLARPPFSFLGLSLQTKAGNKETRKSFSGLNCQHSHTLKMAAFFVFGKYLISQEVETVLPSHY